MSKTDTQDSVCPQCGKWNILNCCITEDQMKVVMLKWNKKNLVNEAIFQDKRASLAEKKLSNSLELIDEMISEMECRGDEDCDHCYYTATLQERVTDLKK